jgi:hypothetical protein
MLSGEEWLFPQPATPPESSSMENLVAIAGTRLSFGQNESDHAGSSRFITCQKERRWAEKRGFQRERIRLVWN